MNSRRAEHIGSLTGVAARLAGEAASALDG
jgi:hypothetical protein